jgi:hypothetical protein
MGGYISGVRVCVFLDDGSRVQVLNAYVVI